VNAIADSQRRRQNGQDVVEFAVILPLLLIILLGIMEFGIIIFSYNTIASAAREGARVSVISDATEDDIVEAVINLAPGLALTRDNITITPGGANSTQVQVQYDLPLISGPIIEALGGNPVVRLQSTATMIRE
jgi:Flp pilus assembly protein TadG